MSDQDATNIYASPQAPMISNTPLNSRAILRETGTLARISQCGLGVLSLFALGMSAVEIPSSIELINGGNPYFNDLGEPTQLSAILDSIASAYTVVHILLVIIFCIWTHKSMSNAHQIEQQKFSSMTSSGWSVGFYFIPILMLWKPFVAMKEMWLASGLSKSSLLGWWWATWIISGFFNQATTKMAADSVDEYSTYAWTALIGNCITIASAVLLILIIQKLTSAQQKFSVPEY